MTRELICIVCPMGCRLTAQIAEGRVSIRGNACPRGARYGEREVTAPERTVTSSVLVEGGAHKLCPVKTAAPVPKPKVEAVLAAIRAARVKAPVALGDVIVANVAGTGVNVVATASRPAL